MATVSVRTGPLALVERQLDALWQKNLKAVGLNVQFQVAQWPENLKAAQAGNFMVWAVGSSASAPNSRSNNARGSEIGGSGCVSVRHERLYV